MADDGGVREVGDLTIWDDNSVFDVGGEVAEAGAEDDPEDWLQLRATADVVGRCLCPAVAI